VFEDTASAALKEAFAELDKDEDRMISISEFIKGIKEAGLQGEDR